MNASDFFTIEVEHEREMLGHSSAKYWKGLREKVAGGSAEHTTPANALTASLIPRLAEKVTEFVDAPPRLGRPHTSLQYLRLIDPNVAAYFTLRAVIKSLSRPRRIVTDAAMLGEALSIELALETADRDAVRSVEAKLARGSIPEHKRLAILREFSESSTEGSTWPENDRIHVGMQLFSFCEDLGLAEIATETTSPNGHPNTKTTLVASGQFVEDYLRYADSADLLDVDYWPTLVPPKNWTGIVDGGYWTRAARERAPLVTRMQKPRAQRVAGELPQPVLKALNGIQSTPWRVNDWMLSVIQAAETHGVPLPHDKEAEPPSKVPWREGATKDEIREYYAARSEAASARSKGFALQRTIRSAMGLQGAVAFYSPVFIDYRGRQYYRVNGLSPQGGDLAKGLLEFARGKVPGAQGLDALSLEVANNYGQDKLPLLDRALWTYSNFDMLELCTKDPLSEAAVDFWIGADNPYKFLATAKDFVLRVRDPSYTSHAVVAADGTCNGLQHLAALARDPATARMVNVLPTGTREDVYSEVASATYARIDELAKKDPEAAEFWSGRGVHRCDVKRSVMNLPYGLTQYSSKAYVRDSLRDSGLGSDRWRMAAALSPLLWDQISKTLPGASSTMAWLQGVAKSAACVGMPVEWKTPDGFLVIHHHLEAAVKKVRIRQANRDLKMTVRKPDPGTLKKARQVSSMAPNFIHSLDATAMRGYVVKALDAGVREFAMVHDSYGCLAEDASIMAPLLRDAFIDTHTAYADAALSHYLESLAINYPELEKGDLDLSVVADSDYFFS